MPDVKVYLTQAEWEYVKTREKGFVRHLVTHYMEAKAKKRMEEIARQPVREEHREKFVEPA